MTRSRGISIVHLMGGILILSGISTKSWGIEPRFTQANDQYRVTNTNNFSGWNDLPAEPGKKPGRSEFSGKSRVVFRERAVARPNAPGALRLVRTYDSVDYERQVDGRLEKARLRPELKRMILDPFESEYVVYSPDSPLNMPELAMLDEHVHLPLLERFLEARDLTPAANWNVPAEALAELTGVDAIESGSVVSKVEGPIDVKGRTFLQISSTGTVIAKTGPVRSRSQVRAGIYLDPENGRFVSMRAIGKQETLGADDNVIGAIDVDYQVLVEQLADDADLNDEVIAKLPLEPTPELVALAFESSALGLRFLHPRRWMLQRIDGPRLFFAGPDASFVVTVEEPDKTPTLEEYHRQVADYMTKQRLDVKATIAPKSEDIEGGKLGHFRFEGTIKDRPSQLDYLLLSRGDRGASIAVNAATTAPADLHADIEKIVRGIEFFPITKPTE